MSVARRPSLPPMPDLGHLTEEERQIIESVIQRQKEEEEKEQEILRSLKDDFENYQASVQKLTDETKTTPTQQVGAVCEICHKTKFADGVGHKCHYCGVRSCARCGGKIALRANKQIWSCNLCKKKQELLVKTGQWYHGGMAKPVALDVDTASDASSIKTDASPPHEKKARFPDGHLPSSEQHSSMHADSGASSEKENMVHGRVGPDGRQASRQMSLRRQYSMADANTPRPSAQQQPQATDHPPTERELRRAHERHSEHHGSRSAGDVEGAYPAGQHKAPIDSREGRHSSTRPPYVESNVDREGREHYVEERRRGRGGEMSPAGVAGPSGRMAAQQPRGPDDARQYPPEARKIRESSRPTSSDERSRDRPAGPRDRERFSSREDLRRREEQRHRGHEALDRRKDDVQRALEGGGEEHYGREEVEKRPRVRDRSVERHRAPAPEQTPDRKAAYVSSERTKEPSERGHHESRHERPGHDDLRADLHDGRYDSGQSAERRPERLMRGHGEPPAKDLDAYDKYAGKPHPSRRGERAGERAEEYRGEAESGYVDSNQGNNQHLDPSSAAAKAGRSRRKIECMLRNDSLSSDPSDCVRPPPPKPHKHRKGKKQRQQSLSSSDDEIQTTPECTSCDEQEIESESVSEKDHMYGTRRECHLTGDNQNWPKDEMIAAKIKKFLAVSRVLCYISMSPSPSAYLFLLHVCLGELESLESHSTAGSTSGDMDISRKLAHFGRNEEDAGWSEANASRYTPNSTVTNQTIYRDFKVECICDYLWWWQDSFGCGYRGGYV